jgi:predicted Fe-S protein YdhL (DUF1289 family)
MSNNAVPSPCVSICALNDDDICVGCYRSAREITEWMLMDDSERREVLRNANERASKNNPFA